MSRSDPDGAVVFVLRGCALVAGLVVLLIAGFLLIEALPAFRQVGVVRFFTDPHWHPTEGTFNLAPMLVGTLAVTLGAVLLATPVALLSAIFVHFYAPAALAVWYRRLVTLLAGVPSVVYGFWGLVNVVPWIAWLRPPGPSLLAGILILALMILPTIAMLADAALAAVPRAYLQGAAALGLSRWATVRGVALPAARSGLVVAVLLGTGRAMGETMAVLMVCGNVVRMPASLFDPVRTLTANIALEMGYAFGTHRAALFVSGLVLLLLVVLITVLVECCRKESPRG